MEARLNRRVLATRALAVAVVAGALYDLGRPPAAQWSARAELAAIALYRERLSAGLAAAGARCRFEPSCSRYAEQAIRRHGALGGTARAAWRIARCGPWTPAGTHDPVR